jgi:hypothetical protein
MLSSWKEESSATTTSAGWPESTYSQRGVPRLPPTKARRSSEKRAPASAVVVDLPLVPVTATSGVDPMKRAASSTSPQIGTPAARAALSCGVAMGTPGETTTRSAAVKSRSSWPPSMRRSGRTSSASSAGPRAAAGRASVTVTEAPSRTQSRAAARPERARPTTVIFLPRRMSGVATATSA